MFIDGMKKNSVSLFEQSNYYLHALSLRSKSTCSDQVLRHLHITIST